MRSSRLTPLFLLLVIPATWFSCPAKVVSALDGDSINVLHDGREILSK